MSLCNSHPAFRVVYMCISCSSSCYYCVLCLHIPTQWTGFDYTICLLFDEGGGHRWRVTDPTDDDHDDIDIGQKSTSWSTAVNMYKYVLCCVDIYFHQVVSKTRHHWATLGNLLPLGSTVKQIIKLWKDTWSTCSSGIYR